MLIYYYDNAATTKIPPQIAEKMTEINTEYYFNAQGLSFAGISAKKIIDDARSTISSYYRVESKNILFTGSGTESDNMAILGVRRRKGCNIIISAVEHSAVYKSALELKRQGYEIRICPVAPSGEIVENELYNLIDDCTTLISIIHVSNETGAINDIVKIAKHSKEINPNVIFHSDGVQAIGKIQLNLSSSKIDLYSFNGHKIGGSKGVGGLYIKSGLTLAPIMFGGGQEGGIRPATENVAAIASMSMALTNFLEKKDDIAFLTMKNQLTSSLESLLGEDIYIISPNNSVPNILYFSLRNVNGETMLHSLEKYGIIVGIGSACNSNTKDNRIGKALGLSSEYIGGVMRISFGLESSLQNVPYIADAIACEYKLIKDKNTVNS